MNRTRRRVAPPVAAPAAPAPPATTADPEVVKDLAQHLLCSQGRKGLRECELKKAVGFAGLSEKERKKYEMHIEEASTDLGKIIGCKVLIPTPDDSAGTNVNKDRKMFVVDTLGSAVAAQNCLSAEEEKLNGFLIVLLTMMFMDQPMQLDSAPLTDKRLWELLDSMDLHQGVVDPFLGDISKLVGPAPSAKFIADGWLYAERIPDTEDFRYDWGPRAKGTIDAVQILEFYCQMMGDEAGEPEGFEEHMKKAKQMRREMRECMRLKPSEKKQKKKPVKEEESDSDE